MNLYSKVTLLVPFAAGLLFSLCPMSILAVQDEQSTAKQSNSDSDVVSITKTADKNYEVKIGEAFFTTFNGRDYAKPILFPVHAVGGTSITRNYPMKKDVQGEADDHPHHKSIWLAHGDVDGYDFWSEKANIKCRTVAVSGSTLSATNHWLTDDKIRVVESTTYTFSQNDDVRFIDIDATLVPGEGFDKVTFGDTKEGFFAIRTHPNLRLTNNAKAGVTTASGQALNSEGDEGKAVWGKEADWVYYWGQIDGQVYGIGIINHTSNFRSPTTWHARDYGLIAANPFGLHDFLQQEKGAGAHSIDSDNPLRLRYRLLISRGKLDSDAMESIFNKYCKTVQ